MRIEKFRNILVPIDFSENAMLALDHAVYLGKHLNAPLTLLHIHETQNLSSTIRKLLFSHPSDEVVLDKTVTEKLEEVAEGVRKHANISVATATAKGRISRKILDHIENSETDLVVMGTHGASGMENFLAGSNTFNVISNAKCPVISVTSSSGSKGIKDIVLPLDLTKETRQKVDEACVFARKFGSTIHICGVTASDDEKNHFYIGKVMEQVDKYVKEEGIPTTNNFFYGENITTITIDYAKSIDADLIVIMNEQEVNPTGFFVGPYAQQMINHSPVPVMTIHAKEKEEHFITPY